MLSLIESMITLIIEIVELALFNAWIGFLLLMLVVVYFAMRSIDSKK